MQYFTAFALTLFWTVNEFQCSDRANDTKGYLPRLVITPNPAEGGGIRPVILGRVAEPLNLTCRVAYQRSERNDIHQSENISHTTYVVSWKTSDQNENRNLVYNTPRIRSGQGENSAWLSFERLTEAHAGDYRCHAVATNAIRQPSFFTDIHLSVKNRVGFCGSGWFKCQSTRCLMSRYVCDGIRDCQDGDDETELAGCNAKDPCEGKVYCGERCLPPTMCCNLGYCNTSLSTEHRHHDPPGVIATDQQRFNDMGFLQTTIYTVIGCAMAFMFIVTILVIMICRAHMKRAMNSRCPPQMRNPGSRPRHSVPLYDLDVYLNRAADLNSQNGLTVTYNINNSVQFVGRPIEPPPYSEVAPVPPREGPPPAYVSRENLLNCPIVDRTVTNHSAGSPLRADARAALIAPFINRNATSSRIVTSFQNNANGSSLQLFTSNQIPRPQATPGFSRFDTSLNSDDASNTTLNTSDSTALNTSSNSDSSSNNSVNNFVISRNITSHSQNFEPEYNETDSLLSENHRDLRVPHAERVVRISENPFALRQSRTSVAEDVPVAPKSSTHLSFQPGPGMHFCWDSEENNGSDETDCRSSNSSENEASFLDCERPLSTSTESSDSMSKEKEIIPGLGDDDRTAMSVPQKFCSRTVFDASSVAGEPARKKLPDQDRSTARSLPFLSNVDRSSDCNDLQYKKSETTDNGPQIGVSVEPDSPSYELKSNLVETVLEPNSETKGAPNNFTTLSKVHSSEIDPTDRSEDALKYSRENLANIATEGKRIPEKSQISVDENSRCLAVVGSSAEEGRDPCPTLVNIEDYTSNYVDASTDYATSKHAENNVSEVHAVTAEDESLVLPLRESFIGVRDQN